MNIEYETQVLDIDVEEISEKLRKAGAEEGKELMQKRWVYDMKPCTADSSGEWIRLREIEGRKPTITYKNKSGSAINGTQEIEIEVDDFEKADLLLSQLEFKGKYYQENRRKTFTLNGTEFVIDYWPQIPPYLEVEGKDESAVLEGLKILGLEGKDAGHIGTIAIYKNYGIDLHGVEVLKFD